MNITIGVDGMMCGMCETHVAGAIRQAFPEARKVNASRKKKQVTLEIDRKLTEEEARGVIESTGYDFTGIRTEQAPEKKRRFGIF